MISPVERPDLHAAYYCASALIRSRKRTGEPIPSWLRQHHARLDAEIRRMSRAGHESLSDTEELHPMDDLITAREAGEILGVSKRQTQRLAADLDGQIVGGRWLFSRSAVAEYMEGKRSA